jgi:hypothetical protein
VVIIDKNRPWFSHPQDQRGFKAASNVFVVDEQAPDDPGTYGMVRALEMACIHIFAQAHRTSRTGPGIESPATSPRPGSVAAPFGASEGAVEEMLEVLI